MKVKGNYTRIKSYLKHHGVRETAEKFELNPWTVVFIKKSTSLKNYHQLVSERSAKSHLQKLPAYYSAGEFGEGFSQTKQPNVFKRLVGRLKWL